MTAAVQAIRELVVGDSPVLDTADTVPLLQLDSLLITEILCLVEEEIGRPLAAETFDPLTSTVGDLIAFVQQRSSR